MKQRGTDKYTIAWFKIADYVSRGEKERALGMYKLLSHSIDNEALRMQLEGDILWTFHDRAAEESYYKAAQLYEKEGNNHAAVCVYEHLLLLSQVVEYYYAILALYKKLNNKAYLEKHLTSLINTLDLEKDYQSMIQILDEYKDYISSESNINFYDKLIIIQAQQGVFLSKKIQEQIEAVVEAYKESEDYEKISSLYTKLKALHDDYATYMSMFIE